MNSIGKLAYWTARALGYVFENWRQGWGQFHRQDWKEPLTWPDAQPPRRMFTEEEVNAIVQKRLSKQQRATSKFAA